MSAIGRWPPSSPLADSPAIHALPSWALVTPARCAHVERVADVLRTWAEQMALDDDERHRWLRACYYHDALRDDPGSTGLDHGPRAAERAAQLGERDDGVLRAVRYHTLGSASWDGVGRALYCADFLEPGRPFAVEERAELAAQYPQCPDDVLRSVVRMRIIHAVQAGWAVYPETVEFWNAVRS